VNYEIFEDEKGRFEAIKPGWSWPACLLTWIWAITKELWTPFWILAIVGFLLFLLHANGMNSITPLDVIVTLVACGIFGMQGNGWVVDRLVRSGYVKVGTVSAADITQAISAYKDQVDDSPAVSTSTVKMPDSPTVAEDAFFTILGLEGMSRARSIYLETMQRTPGAVVFQESRMNKLGYVYLRDGRIDSALEIFSFNAEVFPESPHSMASLADVYKAKGQVSEAISRYGPLVHGSQSWWQHSLPQEFAHEHQGESDSTWSRH
jgi:hypothetical protein